MVEGRARPAWSPEFPQQILKELTIESDDSKEVVKLTFFRGASLPDPEKVCNSSLETNTRRAIDIREGEKLDEAAFKY